MNTRKLFLALFLGLFLALPASFSQVAINANATPPDGSAMLDISSTVRGLLAPRMTLAQRNAILEPATGLWIYQTDNNAGFYYNAGTPVSPLWLRGAGVFENFNGTIRNTGNHATDHFVFGHSALPQQGDVINTNLFFFDKGKGAFRIGRPVGQSWAPDSLGQYSLAVGFGPKAKGHNSVAFGLGESLGGSSFSAGSTARAIGNTSTALGSGLAVGGTSFAAGVAESYGQYSAAFGWASQAIGDRSFVSGTLNTTEGENAAAFGQSSIAKGTRSFTSGWFNNVTGNEAAAFGTSNFTPGTNSLAIGRENISSGVQSFAAGHRNIAHAYASMALGRFNDTVGAASAADWVPADPLLMIGNGADLNNRNNALTMLKNGNTGLGTSQPLARLHVNDASVLFSRPNNYVVAPPPVSGPGFRMMWYAEAGAFRAGSVNGEQWNQANTGVLSFATGLNTTASGNRSFAAGTGNIASGLESTAIGYFNIASGNQSFATGIGSEAIGNYSATMGQGTIARPFASLAIGRYNFDNVGANTTTWMAADPLFMVGNGASNESRNNALMILKNGRTGIGTSSPLARLHVADSSVVFTGTSNSDIVAPPVSGQGIRMMWLPTKSAFRAGNVNGAQWDLANIGIGSLASGSNNIASGAQSFSTGLTNQGIGNLSVAVGEGTIARSYASLAMGRFNLDEVGANTTAWMVNDPLLILGNGTSDIARSNALIISKAGNMGLNTNNLVARLHVDGNVIFSTSNPLIDIVEPGITGAGGRTMWFQWRRAFRTGEVDGAQWDRDNIGYYSIASGLSTTAKAFGSAAFGRFNDPVDASNATTWQAADPLFMVGNGASSASRKNALMILKNGRTGIGTSSPAARLHVADSSVVFTGVAINEAVAAPVSGAGIRMMWLPTKSSFRAGDVNGAQWDLANIGVGSFATGRNNTASGTTSTAIGSGNLASNFYSFATGFNNDATGIAASVFGQNNLAGGNNSVATGAFTTALSFASVAMGRYNDPNDASSTDTWVATDPILTIGNGTGTGANRRNALVVLKNGNIGIGRNNPEVPLAFTPTLGRKIALYPGALGDAGFAIQGNQLQIYSDNANAKVTIGYQLHSLISGGNPTGFQYNLDVFANGNATLRGTLTQLSDERFKKDVAAIEDPLAKINQLNGYHYFWKSANQDGTKQTGLLAQEIEKVMPELVKEDEAGNKSVNYNGMIPYLLEAIKAQQVLIEKQQVQIDALLQEKGK